MGYIESLLDASLLCLVVAWYKRDRTMFYCPHLFYLIEKFLYLLFEVFVEIYMIYDFDTTVQHYTNNFIHL